MSNCAFVPTLQSLPFSLKNFCGLEFGGVQKGFNFLPFLDFLERTFVVWNWGPKGFQFSSIFGFFKKNFCGLGFSFFRFSDFKIQEIKIKNQNSKIKNLILLNNLPNWNFQNVKEFANLAFLNCLGFVYFKESKSKIEFWALKMTF